MGNLFTAVPRSPDGAGFGPMDGFMGAPWKGYLSVLTNFRKYNLLLVFKAELMILDALCDAGTTKRQILLAGCLTPAAAVPQ
jgi:hypothetical protein